MADSEKDHPDAAQDAEQLKPLVEGLIQAIQTIDARLNHLEGGHGALSKLVTDDLIGGIHNMYKAKMKGDRIEMLKSKYGEMLQPHLDALSEIAPGDHWGNLHDLSEGMDDEALDGHMKALAGGLKDKLDRVRGVGSPVVAKVEAHELPPEEGKKVEGAVKTIEKTADKAAEKAPEKGEEEAPVKKKSKDELIAEKMSKSKDFKLR